MASVTCSCGREISKLGIWLRRGDAYRLDLLGVLLLLETVEGPGTFALLRGTVGYSV